MSHVTFKDLSNDLASHLDKLEMDRSELIVTRQDHEPVVIVPLAEWEGMKESLHLLSTPANAQHLRNSITDANAGKLAEHSLVDP